MSHLDRPKAPGAASLVVGGGLLGSHLALRLAAAGSRTTVFSRSFNPILSDAAADADIRLVAAEVEASGELEAAIEAAADVYYMAGSSTPGASVLDPAASLVGSVAPALTVMELVRRAGGRRLALASSGGTVYGCPSVFPTAEEAPLEPISIHGLNAVAMERYAHFYAERHSLDVVILRYSNPYGPGQVARRGQGVVAAWARAARADEPIVLYGDGSVRRDFVYVEDAVEATVLLTASEARGAVNVGSNSSTSMRELVAVLEAVADRPLRVEFREGRGVDVPTVELDCARAGAIAGWTASTDLEAGVAASWQWLERHEDVEPRVEVGSTSARRR